MADSRPVALPPAERTIGQLIAESVRFYGDNFWTMLPLGFVLVAVDLASLHRGFDAETVILWAAGPLFAAAYVRAATIAFGAEWSWSAFATGVIVFLPFPVLVRLYILPGLIWFALLGLAVPAAVKERLGVGAALRRGLQLSRADLVHALGGMVTLGVVYFVSRIPLGALIHSFGDQGATAATVLSDFVISPLLFIGGALLYVDQAARVR